MKKSIILTILITWTVVLFAQNKTNYYMSKIPGIPSKSCEIKKTDVESFSNQVGELIDKIDDEIGQLNKQVENQNKVNESKTKEAMLKKMQQQYGLSSEDAAKMKNSKNLTKEEKKALANKVMNQQTNMSMEDVKNLKNMSESGKKAYAQSIATESMAVQESNSQNKATDNGAGASYKLVKEQQALMTKINENSQKIGNLYEAIENDPDGLKMLENIKKWREELGALGGVDYGQGGQMELLATQIKNEEIQYCKIFTSKYHSALDQHLSNLKTSLPDYKKLVEVSSALTKSQTGVGNPPEAYDIACLGAIRGYLEKLKGAYKFKLYYPEDN